MERKERRLLVIFDDVDDGFLIIHPIVVLPPSSSPLSQSKRHSLIMSDMSRMSYRFRNSGRYFARLACTSSTLDLLSFLSFADGWMDHGGTTFQRLIDRAIIPP